MAAARSPHFQGRDNAVAIVREKTKSFSRNQSPDTFRHPPGIVTSLIHPESMMSIHPLAKQTEFDTDNQRLRTDLDY